MRPIDADALMEKLNGIWDCNDMTFAPVDGCCIDADCKSCRWRETIEYVKRLVQNQTTLSPWRRVEEPTKEGQNVLTMDANRAAEGGRITTYKTDFDEKMESSDCLKLYFPSKSTLDVGLGVIFKSDGIYHVVVKGGSISIDKVSGIPKMPIKPPKED